jgi:predicted  nucleic acid-binding Zn-ribbon protein
MAGPKITGKEYTVLQEQLAGVLADLQSLTERGIDALTRAEEAEGSLAELRAALAEAQQAYQAAKEELEGSLSDVREELERRTRERDEFVGSIGREPLAEYERVRLKYKDALAAVDGTIDRAAGRIGNDLHCSACYMAVTSNDAVNVLRGTRLLRCKSCTRILYVP